MYGHEGVGPRRKSWAVERKQKWDHKGSIRRLKRANGRSHKQLELPVFELQGQKGLWIGLETLEEPGICCIQRTFGGGGIKRKPELVQRRTRLLEGSLDVHFANSTADNMVTRWGPLELYLKSLWIEKKQIHDCRSDNQPHPATSNESFHTLVRFVN